MTVYHGFATAELSFLSNVYDPCLNIDIHHCLTRMNLDRQAAELNVQVAWDGQQDNSCILRCTPPTLQPDCCWPVLQTSHLSASAQQHRYMPGSKNLSSRLCPGWPWLYSKPQGPTRHRCSKPHQTLAALWRWWGICLRSPQPVLLSPLLGVHLCCNVAVAPGSHVRSGLHVMVDVCWKRQSLQPL